MSADVPRIPVALSIAGSDPSGGAGVQADLKAFADHAVYGMAALTALTAQNTRGVSGVFAVPADFIRAQIAAVRADLPPDAVKIGMLGTGAIARAVAAALDDYDGPLVLDPVMVATSGDPLLEPAAEEVVVEVLLPRAWVITPNRPEAARLGLAADPGAFAARTGVAVLLKDGHGDGPLVEDRLFLPGGAVHRFAHPRVATRNTHGTGCTLASAVAARLARGESLEAACAGAVDYLGRLVAGSAGHRLGGGHGPLLHGIVARGEP